MDRQGIEPGQLGLGLHADRGSAMTSKSFAFLLSDLGMTKDAFATVRVERQPFSESAFKASVASKTRAATLATSSLGTPSADGAPTADDPTPKPTGSRYRPYAELLKRTFALDVLERDRSHGRMKLVSMVTERPTERHSLLEEARRADRAATATLPRPPYWKSHALRRICRTKSRSPRSHPPTRSSARRPKNWLARDLARPPRPPQQRPRSLRRDIARLAPASRASKKSRSYRLRARMDEMFAAPACPLGRWEEKIHPLFGRVCTSEHNGER
jgi:hypothetical protein